MPTADNSYFTLVQRLNARTLANGYFPNGIAIDESIQMQRDVGNTTYVFQAANEKTSELPCSCYNIISKVVSEQAQNNQTSSSTTPALTIPFSGTFPPPSGSSGTGRNGTAGNISGGGPTGVGTTP